MAIVKIPENARPFVATVNGKKYVYDPGKTVDVPEERVKTQLAVCTSTPIGRPAKEAFLALPEAAVKSCP